MTITKDVIADLLPLYISDECSPDTKLLIDEYLKANPEFAMQIKQFSQNPLPNSIPHRLNKEDEMKTLAKTQRLIKRRTWLMGFAIFCTLAPFSVLHTGEKTYWLFLESPGSASVYAVLAVIFWAGYFMTKRNLRGI